MVVSKALTAAVALMTLVAASAGSARATEMYTHDTVTLHSGPGDRFGTVSTLGAGEQITVLWCNSAGWCRVQSNLFEGWAPMAELIPITGLGAGGVVLNGTNQAPAGDPNISAIIAASPDESPNSLSGGDGTADAASASTGGAGLSVSSGGSSLLSLKVR